MISGEPRTNEVLGHFFGSVSLRNGAQLVDCQERSDQPRSEVDIPLYVCKEIHYGNR